MREERRELGVVELRTQFSDLNERFRTLENSVSEGFGNIMSFLQRK